MLNHRDFGMSLGDITAFVPGNVGLVTDYNPGCFPRSDSPTACTGQKSNRFYETFH